MIWTAPDIATVMQDAPLELQQAMSLALHMGQRYGDLIRLRWADYRGETIRLRQNKTRARVTIHVSPAPSRFHRSGPVCLIAIRPQSGLRPPCFALRMTRGHPK